MSDKCGDCDCADKSQCVKKGNQYGIIIDEAQKFYDDAVVMGVSAAENDGKCNEEATVLTAPTLGEEQRGRLETKQIKKKGTHKASKSHDIVTDLDIRVVKLELVVGNMRENHNTLADRVEEQHEDLHGEGGFKGVLQGMLNALADSLRKSIEELQVSMAAELNTLKA
ncbi:cystathionine beta-lyase [Ancistrocladus abbreviatus]